MNKEKFREMLLDLLQSDKEVERAVYNAVEEIKDDESRAESRCWA